jgi:myo-inositol-1-phosphate synthase
VGSEEAQRFYAQACLDAGVAFVNAIPVFIASDPEWAAKFEAANVPIVGDDIKSQVGATITHRMLARLFEDRGTAIDRTYQLNFGGNMDFKNMLERTRLESKKISKTQSVTSQIEQGIESDNVHIGPSDHVPWLDDRKWAYIRLEGRNFGDVPLSIELKLEVWDSPNSAGVIIDAVRCCKLALDRGIGGPLAGPSAYFMKSPAVQYHDDEAREMVEKFANDLSEPER